ncbi:heat shock protein beta-1-like [Salvelinus alpinus]|uniref:heat shock protein beta-1-like n=1 Tax=Salvelinus alpinus TaxID=8036 RepID=UPI0039FBEBCA
MWALIQENSLNHVPFTMLREPNFDLFRNWHHSTRLFDQSFGMPQIPDKWSHWPGSHWPGYMCPPGSSVDVGFYFYCLMGNPYACTMSRQLRSGLSERKQTHDSWRISLDVNQFAPEELMVKAKDRVTEIIGKHEERRVQGMLSVKVPLPMSAVQEGGLSMAISKK